ncbi:hypothetical protein [Ornithinimicrobium cavernae]|uniref:hypothetical protein n=1 Tax=Ornithinimicrobium cavernae TaxID=2666047 RepID=UPI0012B1730E|nr:hypothetical protein [Ornithinimicrobium cavernae]
MTMAKALAEVRNEVALDTVGPAYQPSAMTSSSSSWTHPGVGAMGVSSAQASGLLFDASGGSTVTARRLLAVHLELVKPAVESDSVSADQQWEDLVDRLARAPRCLGADDFRIAELHAFVAQLAEQGSRMEPGARLVIDGLLLGDAP